MKPYALKTITANYNHKKKRRGWGVTGAVVQWVTVVWHNPLTQWWFKHLLVYLWPSSQLRCLWRQPQQSTADTHMEFLAQDLTWCNPVCCSDLESDPVEEGSLPLCDSTIEISKYYFNLQYKYKRKIKERSVDICDSLMVKTLASHMRILGFQFRL